MTFAAECALDADHVRLLQALVGRRFRFEDEKRLQGELAAAFTAAGIRIDREVALDCAGFWEGEREPLGVIDFLAGDVGIEVKIKGSAADAFRQLKRYAESDRIGSLILVTSKAMALPPRVLGKRLTKFDLGRAWL